VKEMPCFIVYSQVGSSITNALLYQLSYSGVLILLGFFSYCTASMCHV
jgi:hypothetical protein